MKTCQLLQRTRMLVVLLTSFILIACVAVDEVVEPIAISGSVSFGKRVLSVFVLEFSLLSSCSV